VIHEVKKLLKMTTNLKHSASIEQYLANEMAPTERTAFRKELRSNPELASELKLSQSIDSAIVRDDIIDLRQKLIAAINANRTVKTEVPVIRMYTRKWWYAAASLLVLCAVAATLFLQTNRNISNDALFSQYYNAENIVDQTRGDQNILEAVIKFQQKDFAAASSLFKNILEKDNSNIAVWFYYGISNIETKNYDNSIKAFSTIIKQNDNLYIEHAEWYLGLCYLKNNQKDKAIDQFIAVASNPDNYHRQEAKNILEKLQLK
jgi:tetratricopeptide (TPR) repeat protein